ncbi:MAG TPA: hypothetical protein VLE70_14285 [Anaerolineae bacterium]|jgi:hypothetical protein|nr:hypothetical protein [Anaerolineae bacterium]
MFDFLRDFGKSEEEKRQEALSAYLDNALTPAETERFEQLLASDEALQASLEEQQHIQASIHRLPRMRAPRNFTLDPALYGRPMPATADRLYPILRTATAVVAVLFAIVLVLDFLPIGDEAGDAGQPLAISTESQIAAEEAPAAAEAPVEEAPAAALIEQAEVEITLEVEMPAEAPAEEMAAEEAAQAPEPAVEGEAAGLGTPSGEAPAEAAPVLEPSFADEGLADAAPEAESAGEEIAEAPLQPQATTAAGRAVERATLTAADQELPPVGDEDTTTQQTPAPRASPAAPESDDLATDGASDEAPGPKTETTLTSNQIVTIILGLGLLVLFVATLLLRRRSRTLS